MTESRALAIRARLAAIRHPRAIETLRMKWAHIILPDGKTLRGDVGDDIAVLLARAPGDLLEALDALDRVRSLASSLRALLDVLTELVDAVEAAESNDGK